ncbi:GNAT family N-acetyltransferase [Acinetobacter pragensis]|uniref:GNAT family N-acetyltransferase n=1 Tax=Acinetobacter pragensis TaxID=1806892 RepID=UPI00333FE6D8
MALNFRLAKQNDLQTLALLMNQAYRSQTGQSWTNEAEIVAGPRITQTQLQESLLLQNFELWVLEDHQQNESGIWGCIGLTINHDAAEIGSFCVDPFLQNMGLGRKLLNFAENYITQAHADIKWLDMYVLNVRAELISFYERCGYVKSERIEDYPVDANVGIPLVDLHLIQLRKSIAALA